MIGRTKRFRRTRSGAYELRLPAEEAEVVRSIAGQLSELLNEDPEAPATRRLFPTAYPDDEEADAEFRRLVVPDLLSSRLAAVATLEAALDGDKLDDGQAAGVLGALNDLRLVLGTILDVTEDLEPGDLGRDDPRAYPFAVYWFLGGLQEEVIEVLSRR